MEILHNLFFFSHPFIGLSGARRWSKLRWVWVSMSRATSNDTTVPMVVMSKPLAATSVAISKFLPRASRGYERCLWHQRKVKVWNGVKMCEVGWSSNYPSSPIFVGYTAIRIITNIPNFQKGSASTVRTVCCPLVQRPRPAILGFQNVQHEVGWSRSAWW